MRATLRNLFRSTLTATQQHQPSAAAASLANAVGSSSSASSSVASGSRQGGAAASSSRSPGPAPTRSGALRRPPLAAGNPAAAAERGRGAKPFVKSQYYSPRTLSLPALTAPPTRRAPPLLGPSRAEAVKSDPIHRLGLRPSKPSLSDDSYKNPVLLSQFISEMGRIKPRSLTGLTRRSQREVGKAVRRARAMGLLPTMSDKAATFRNWHKINGMAD